VDLIEKFKAQTPKFESIGITDTRIETLAREGETAGGQLASNGAARVEIYAVWKALFRAPSRGVDA